MSRRLLAVGSYAASAEPSSPVHALRPGVVTVVLDDGTGELGVLDSAPAPGPVSWLAGSGRQLTAAVQSSPGVVAGYTVDDGGALRAEWHAASGGDSPCHLDVHPVGARIAVAHYADGRVTVLRPPTPARPAAMTGVLQRQGSGPDLQRQERSHPHLASYLASGELLVADLGTDELVTYPCDPHGELRGERPTRIHRRPAGSGPRHVAAFSAGRLVVLSELSATLEVIDLSPTGDHRRTSGTKTQVVTTARGGEAVRNYPSVVTVSASGRLAYVANRGPDTVSTFDLTGPVPRQVGECPAGGRWPQALLLAGNFLVVAAQHSDVLTVLELGAHGLPGATRAELPLPSPSCVIEIAGVTGLDF